MRGLTPVEMVDMMAAAPAGTHIIAYKTMLKELAAFLQRYEWHDLTKDPSDLPPDGCEDDFFECCLVGPSGKGYNYDHGYEILEWFGANEYEDEQAGFDTPGSAKVIAWRYIEPFEENEEW